MADISRLSALSLHSSSASLFTSFASTLNSRQLGLPPNFNLDKKSCSFFSAAAAVVDVSSFHSTSRKQLLSFKVHATITETNQPKWWEKNAGPNMIDIHSTQEILTALSEAGDRLVIVEFYGTWCASCRALFHAFCDHYFRTAQENPEIMFLKVDFDENKPMCKSLNVKVLPYFHFYRGAHGQLESFSCSLAKFQKIKDAIKTHRQPHCDVGPSKGVEDLNLESVSVPIEKPAVSTLTRDSV